FYTRVLGFERTTDIEQSGESIEQLEGVFGAHTRTVRVQLGRECLDLIEYLGHVGVLLRSTAAATTAGSSMSPSWSPTWMAPMLRCARRASSTHPPDRRGCPTG